MPLGGGAGVGNADREEEGEEEGEHRQPDLPHLPHGHFFAPSTTGGGVPRVPGDDAPAGMGGSNNSPRPHAEGDTFELATAARDEQTFWGERVCVRRAHTPGNMLTTYACIADRCG